MPRVGKPAVSKRSTTQPRGKARKKADEEASFISQAEIAKRAYDLFLRDGAAHGRDVDHWLLAERQLLNKPMAQSD